MPGPLILLIQVLAAILAFGFFADSLRRVVGGVAGTKYEWVNLVLIFVGIGISVFVFRSVGEWLS